MKKGQITVFIILGILLMLGLVSMYFLLFSTQQKKIETPNQLEAPDVGPIREFVRQCIVKHSLEGINLLGIQGGHIYSYPSIENVGLPNDEGFKVVGNARLAKGTGNNKIPYWMTEEQVAVPTTEYMQKELQDFLEENVPKCADFSTMEEQGYIVKTGKMTANVTIGKAVAVDIHWPAQIEFAGKKYSIEDYAYEVPVNLGLIRDIAEELTGFEASTAFLESHAKNVISIYSYGGGSKGQFELPPFSFTDPSCSSVSWTLADAESKTRAILEKNFAYLKISNTNFDKIKDPTYESFIWQFFPNLPNVKIDLRYDQLWPTVFDIQPRKGQSIKADKFSQSQVPFLPMFCVHKYQNKYTIKAPIMIKITDNESAKVGEFQYEERKGFSFYFPIKMHICGNQERRCTGKLNFTVNITEVFGENVSKQIYDCETKGEEIKLSVTDETGVIADAEVFQECEGYLNDCSLGTTDRFGVLTAIMPQCENPKIRIEKEDRGTLHAAVQPSYVLDKINTINLTIELVRAKQFLAAHYMTKGFTKEICGKSPEEMLLATKYQLRQKDDIIILTKGGLTPTILYPIMNQLLLAKGDYNATLTVKGEVVIKPSEYKTDNGITKVSFDINPLTKGDYKGIWPLGTSTFNWKIEPGKKKMKAYAFVEHLSDDDLQVSSFDDNVIGDGLYGTIYIDENCDGLLEERTHSVSVAEYSRILAPEFG